MKVDTSPTGSFRVIAGTISITLICVAIAVFVDSFNFTNLTEDAIRRSLLVDIFLPTFLAGPLLFVLLRKVQQLAISHRELSIIASTDSLTAVLNRGAFTLLVESYLARAEEHAALRSGSLLVIDADHFKEINDSLGHQQGDEALKIIAETIKRSLRQADIVGRIGGEEFGVFLPGAAAAEASEIAERIRDVICKTVFPLKSNLCRLSVSVGGVSFNRQASYDELFSRADSCLYAAKEKGRNRVDLVYL
ncbi:GGDEF domain-containing protein [Rhizobium tubonense]|uniref:diguanylate cyclase n=1 Tax=Rhizobium tubonense TaxID=484088 RepID=A0A2W4E4A2_9HYPH|nr:GGDEF domain-containing protein [Rhizobium tubonense]PZM10446.1 GGDEF domain-containing protein [Rhizobium tubonense]